MLDFIRSEISTMLAFKERYESAIRDPLKVKKEQQELMNLRQSNQKLQELLLEAEREKQSLKEEVKNLQVEKKALSREKADLKSKLDAETARLKVELDTLAKETTATKAHSQKSHQQKQKMLEEQIKEIQLDKEAMEKHLKQRINNLTIDNAKAVQTLEEKLTEALEENKQLLASQQIVSRDFARSTLQNRDSTPERTTSPIIAKGHPQWFVGTMRNLMFRGQLQKLRGQVFEYKKRIKQLKKDIEIMKMVRQPHANSGSSPNHAYIEVYKKAIKDKDREISAYQNKVTSLLGVSQKADLMKKTAELARLERDAVIDELSAIKRELNLGRNTGNGMSELQNWMNSLPPVIRQDDSESSSDEEASKKRPKTAPIMRIRSSRVPQALLDAVAPP